MEEMPGRSAILIAFALIVGLSACGVGPFDSDDSGVCRQPGGEFGIYACTVVEGRVVGSQGQPLDRITVGPYYRDESRGVYDSPFSDTDENGNFRFTIHRYYPPAVVPLPDTLTIMVAAAAADRKYPMPDYPRATSDSVAVTVTFAPVGAAAPVSQIRIKLPIP